MLSGPKGTRFTRTFAKCTQEAWQSDNSRATQDEERVWLLEPCQTFPGLIFRDSVANEITTCSWLVSCSKGRAWLLYHKDGCSTKMYICSHQNLNFLTTILVINLLNVLSKTAAGRPLWPHTTPPPLPSGCQHCKSSYQPAISLCPASYDVQSTLDSLRRSNARPYKGRRWNMTIYGRWTNSLSSNSQLLDRFTDGVDPAHSHGNDHVH